MVTTLLHVGAFHIPQWLQDHLSAPARGVRERWAYFSPDVSSTMGVSGGQTSMLMWLLWHAQRQRLIDAWSGHYADSPMVASFANTGREHEGTLQFLDQCARLAEQPIIWVEYQRPDAERAQYEPRHADYRIVDYATANRTGQPWLDMLETFRVSRQHKGLPALAPSAAQRICTVQLKIRPRERLARDRFGASSMHDSYIGMRADEPQRVAALAAADTARITHRTPLADAGITRDMVLRFWSEQPVRLEIPEHAGNCTGCFLKDVADIATVFTELPEEAGFWERIERNYAPMLPKAGRWSYQLIRETLPRRLELRQQLAAGAIPEIHRWEVVGGKRRASLEWLMLQQEMRRREQGSSAFSCGCASALAAGERELEV